MRKFKTESKKLLDLMINSVYTNREIFLRELKKAMQSAERKMATQRARLDETRALMQAADPSDFAALMELQARLDDQQQRLDELELEWLEAAEALGE